MKFQFDVMKRYFHIIGHDRVPRTVGLLSQIAGDPFIFINPVDVDQIEHSSKTLTFTLHVKYKSIFLECHSL